MSLPGAPDIWFAARADEGVVAVGAHQVFEVEDVVEAAGRGDLARRQVGEDRGGLGAEGQAVLVGTPEHPVGVPAPFEEIVAGASVDDVGAGPTVDEVVSAQAQQDVVAGVPPEGVGGVGAREVVALAGALQVLDLLGACSDPSPPRTVPAARSAVMPEADSR